MRIHLATDQVSLNGLDISIWWAIAMVSKVYTDHGLQSIIIAQGLEGPHVAGSPASKGYGITLRVRAVPDALGMLQQMLGLLPENFDVELKGEHLVITNTNAR